MTTVVPLACRTLLCPNQSQHRVHAGRTFTPAQLYVKRLSGCHVMRRAWGGPQTDTRPPGNVNRVGTHRRRSTRGVVYE
jgi:hypothetical protein